MAILPNSSFVRVLHLGNSQGSIYLNDIDTYLNRYPELKIPVYVPFERTIDIPLVDEVLISYNRGSLHKHAQNNLIEVFIFSEKSVVELINVTNHQSKLDSDIILVNTSLSDVTVTLPDLSILPEGREIFIKKTTDDVNNLIIEAQVPDQIDRDSLEVITSAPFGAFTLRAGAGGWWIASEHPSGTVLDDDGGGGGGDFEPVKIYANLASRDSTEPSFVYVGKVEAVGTSEDSPSWRIYRQNVANTNTPQEFAGGTVEYIHKWTERESLTYEEI